MNCIIIDDDPQSVENIEEFILKVPYLKLAAKCSNAFEAFDILKQTVIDLIFLEIELPLLSGIDFIKNLEVKPMFVFVTRTSQYALESYDINALDYLVKPVIFNRFFKSVNKAFDLYTLKKSISLNQTNQNFPILNAVADKFLLVKTDYQTIRIDLESIYYIEGLKDYVKIYTSGTKPVITLNSLKNLTDKLPSEEFVRVHKSYIVALSKIQSISRGRIINIGDKVIPVGEVYKDAFNELISKHNITK